MFTQPKEIEAAFSIRYLVRLEFASEDILHKARKKSAWKLRWKKHARTNSWGLHLFGEAFLKNREVAYEIKKINPLVGFGVFAREKIPAWTYVGEYVGVVRKRHKKNDQLNDYVFGYVVGPHDTRWVIDAQRQGNFTRFINHSYEPNLTSKWLIVDGLCHIILFSNRLILPEEQLTYDYGPYYWRRRPQPQNFYS